MKKIVITAIVVAGLAVGYAYAHSGGYMGGYGHHGGGHMMGGPGAMMGPEMMHGGYANCPGWNTFSDSGWNSPDHRRYLKETAGLRKELHDKRFEYNEMRRNPNTTGDRLAAIEKDIIDIRTKLQNRAEQFK